MPLYPLAGSESAAFKRGVEDRAIGYQYPPKAFLTQEKQQEYELGYYAECAELDHMEWLSESPSESPSEGG